MKILMHKVPREETYGFWELRVHYRVSIAYFYSVEILPANKLHYID